MSQDTSDGCYQRQPWIVIAQQQCADKCRGNFVQSTNGSMSPPSDDCIQTDSLAHQSNEKIVDDTGKSVGHSKPITWSASFQAIRY